MFIWDKFICLRSKCRTCKHLRSLEGGCTCAAFPYDDLKRGHGIPGAFLEAYKTHDSVVEGQIGDFVYTPV